MYSQIQTSNIQIKIVFAICYETHKTIISHPVDNWLISTVPKVFVSQSGTSTQGTVESRTPSHVIALTMASDITDNIK